VVVVVMRGSGVNLAGILGHAGADPEGLVRDVTGEAWGEGTLSHGVPFPCFSFIGITVCFVKL